MFDENLNLGFVKEKEQFFNKNQIWFGFFKCERKTFFFYFIYENINFI